MRHNYPGMLIVFEGADGAGKGTQISMLRRELELRKPAIDRLVFTKEPGGTEFGAEVRKILFETIGTKNMTGVSRQLLCLSAHVEHSQRVIIPALKAGSLVVVDRYLYSDLAYQEDSTPPMLTELKKSLMGPQPDLLFHLHGDPGVFLPRALARTTETHEAAKAWAKVDRLRQVQNNYFRIFLPLAAQSDPCPYVPLDADVLSAADLFESQVKRIAFERIRKHFNLG